MLLPVLQLVLLWYLSICLMEYHGETLDKVDLLSADGATVTQALLKRLLTVHRHEVLVFDDLDSIGVGHLRHV